MTAAQQLALDLESPVRARVEGAFKVYVADGTEDGGHGPLPIAADSVPQAEQIAATLAGVEPEACLALPAREDDWSTELMALLDGAKQRAEDDLQHLRAIHAKILRIPIEELDARVAADEAEQRAERDKFKAVRRQPLPKKEKRSLSGAGSSAEPAGVHASEPSGDRGGPSAPSALPMRRLTELQRELLRGFEVAGNVARYTSTEHQPDWAQVKAVFVALGGKWRTGGKKKTGGFHFADDLDAAELVRLALVTGEVLDPLGADYFPTPAGLADRLAELAELRPGDAVLEPSAGQGALARAVRRACPTARISCVELLPANRAVLTADGFDLIGEEFLGLSVDVPFDVIVANPPFSGRADVHHISHMLRLLRVGGRLAAIASAGVRYRDDRVGREFRETLGRHAAVIEDNPEGSFAQAGTMVRTVTISLTKGARS